MSQPLSVPADGYLGVLWVPSISDVENPTAAELNAVAVVDISCYLTGGGFANALDEQTIADPRLCSRQTFEQPGKFTHSLTLMYVYNLKSPSNNAAYLALTYQSTGFIVARYGVPFDDLWVATDIVDVRPSKLGKRFKVPGEDNSVQKISQKVYITGDVAEDVVVV